MSALIFAAIFFTIVMLSMRRVSREYMSKQSRTFAELEDK